MAAPASVKKSSNIRPDGGQSLVEFTFAIPLILLTLFGIIYFGRYFYVSQALVYAAQESARIAARVPNLSDPSVRDMVRGFDQSGAAVNSGSALYAALSSARLLSAGAAGDLPTGSQVKILPWDADGSANDDIPPGTVAVAISYPYNLLGASNNGAPAVSIAMSAEPGASPVTLHNVVISERAVAAREVFQEVN